MNYFRMLIRILIILLLFVTAGELSAETPGTMAAEAQKAYQAGDYPHAMQKWEELRSVGYVNGNLFSNLGNAAWQLGQGGRARWYYLRGLALDPRNGALRNNLQFVEEKLGLGRRDFPEGPIGVLQGLSWWKLSLNFFELLKAAAILSAVYFGWLFLKKWQGRSASKWWLWGLGIPLAVLACLLVFHLKKLYFSREAVVLSAQAALLSAPASEAVTGQNLPEGSIVPIRKKQGDFRLVKTPQGNPAWVEANQLGLLSL
jgi:hypothetical protein